VQAENAGGRSAFSTTTFANAGPDEFLTGDWITLASLDDEPGGIFDPYKPITATYRRASSDTSQALIGRFVVFSSESYQAVPEQDFYFEGATDIGNGVYEFEIPQGAMDVVIRAVPYVPLLWDSGMTLFTELIHVRNGLGQTLDTAIDKRNNPGNIADIYIDYAGDTMDTKGREQLDVADADTLIAYLSVGVPIAEIGITGHATANSP
jgi:hypothetical protein